MQPNICLKISNTAYQILFREGSGSPWNVLVEEKTSIERGGGKDRGRLYVRANVDHFSQGCLGRRVHLDSPYHQETVMWGKPAKRELEFVNATSRPLIFLVLPTFWSNRAVFNTAMGLVAQGVESNLAISRAVQQSILHEAIDPQFLQLPAKQYPVKHDERPRQLQDHDGSGGGLDGHTDPGGSMNASERCPFVGCSISGWTGSDVRVALVTVDAETLAVWDYRTVRDRSRVAVLPGQFSKGMVPLLGVHRLCDLRAGTVGIGSGGQCSLLHVALMAMVKGMSCSREPLQQQQQHPTAPVSTVQ